MKLDQDNFASKAGFGHPENDDDFDTLKINTAFAERFEHNQRRKLLEQGKLKYGDRLNDG